MTQSNPPPTGPRPRKQTLLKQTRKLARKGLSPREIAARLGVSKTTVVNWLRTIRQQRAARQALDPAAVLRRKIARYQSISDKLFAAWRDSQAALGDTGGLTDPAAIRDRVRLAQTAFLAEMSAKTPLHELPTVYRKDKTAEHRRTIFCVWSPMLRRGNVSPSRLGPVDAVG